MNATPTSGLKPAHQAPARGVHAASPPTRAEARAQFDFWTDKLQLRHTFDFDEVYEQMLARRQQQDFRAKINEFERRASQLPAAQFGNCFPLVHTFAQGLALEDGRQVHLYVRQLTVPPQTLTVTKIHAQEHPFFLLQGHIAILTENGVEHLAAPHVGVTRRGTKRIIWHKDEVIFCTCHATLGSPATETLEAIEDSLTAPDFAALEDSERIQIENFANQMKGQIPCHLSQ